MISAENIAEPATSKAHQSALKIKPTQIVVWGYTESLILATYLQGKNIWRLEDGFVRSAALGASHATPYSLVLDKTGF